ncbi:tetratricopeptide repeat protein [Ancylothrix sp. C2]|uniref:O-linked N-acetylglucosamine transferase family protein n=1 Tax=Ancylothrix sp. D3o TaxID=2953691 RepID=UPI0021BB892F|nr:tetratricopeptide repeat protein [Ancylothrix sp. D3o]MCT7950819.1 tetratricopeptide repeat protein [Ancylothrix sp. D3o]
MDAHFPNTGNLEEAEKTYQKILQTEPTSPEALQNLAVIYYLTQRYQEAKELLVNGIQENALNARGYYTLGLVLEELGNPGLAAQAYKDAIALDESWSDAYNNLGNIYLSVGNIERAEEIFWQGILADPDQFGSYVNMGNVLVLRCQIDEAMEAYETALQLKPGDEEILQNLEIVRELKKEPEEALLYAGNYFYKHQRYQETIEIFTKFLEHQKGEENLYEALAQSYQKLEEYEKAIKTYQKAIRLYPKVAELYLGLIGVLGETGNPHEVIEIAETASKIFPKQILFKFIYHLTLPIIYNNYQEIEYYRTRYSEELTNFIKKTPLKTEEDKQNALAGISQHSNFFLAAQGYNDLDLQKQYGNWVHQIVAGNYPQWVQPRKMPPVGENGKIRIGYVSGCFWGHTVGKLSLGWVRHHNPEKFEIYCYYLNTRRDEYTETFKKHSHKFSENFTDIETLAQEILADNLHILTYIDIGQQAQITPLAAMRLAPVQCTTWAHPETSGLPTIDYFLSSELMEPANPQQHYSEQVVLLPNLGISYAKPVLPQPTKTRADFQLRNDGVVYLCCQTFHKYLPQYDGVFAAIAQRVPQAQFVFIARPNTAIAERFKQRIKRAFANYNLNADNYCVILPKLNQDDYWNLNLISNIYLDSFGWSGGHTTLEALACNLPVVTYPGELMRGRHSYGILKRLNLTSLIAKEKADYIEIAVRLGTDTLWKNNILERLKTNENLLWDDLKPIKTLEKFYERLVTN